MRRSLTYGFRMYNNDDVSLLHNNNNNISRHTRRYINIYGEAIIGMEDVTIRIVIVIVINIILL